MFLDLSFPLRDIVLISPTCVHIYRLRFIGYILLIQNIVTLFYSVIIVKLSINSTFWAEVSIPLVVKVHYLTLNTCIGKDSNSAYREQD